MAPLGSMDVSEMRQLEPSLQECTEEELCWFLRDRRGDSQAAAKKAAKAIRWRQEGWGGLASDSGTLVRLAASEARLGVGYLAPVRDVMGRPAVVVVARRHFVTRRSLEASKALCISVLDAACDAIDEDDSVEQFVAIVDLRSIGPSQVDIQFVIWLISILRNYYPKRLGQVALVDPPRLLFDTAWSLIKPQLGEHASMVRLVRSRELRQYFAADDLPTDLRRR